MRLPDNIILLSTFCWLAGLTAESRTDREGQWRRKTVISASSSDLHCVQQLKVTGLPLRLRAWACTQVTQVHVALSTMDCSVYHGRLTLAGSHPLIFCKWLWTLGHLLIWLLMHWQAVKEAAERQQQHSESAAASAALAQPKPKPAPLPKRKTAVPLVRVRPAKKQSKQQAISTASSDSRLVEGRPAESNTSNGHIAEKHEGETEASEDGLGGLIGAYGSESSESE